MNFARYILVAIAAVSGVLIAARMLLGPFPIAGVPVNVPLNPEGLFGLLITVALALGVLSQQQAAPSLLVASPVPPGWWAIGLVALSLASLWSVLRMGFVSDDFILIRMATHWTWANFVAVLTQPGGDGFFRPLGYLSLALDGRWAGTNTTVWHASALTIHILNAVMVLALGHRLGLSVLAAFLGGGLFALHGTHPEAAVWIAGRFDLLATFFTLLGLLFFLHSLHGDPRCWAFRAGGLICAACAMLSKEAAFVFPFLALIVAWWLDSPRSIEDDRPLHAGRGSSGVFGFRSWLRPCLPYFAVAGAIFLYRTYLLGGLGGYVVAETGQSAVFSLKLPTTAKVIFVRLWTSLYFPINWSAEPSLWLTVAAALAIGALIWLALRSRPSPLLWIALGCLGVSILPPLHLLGGAADLSGGRLLYLPSVWFCMMIAAGIDGLARNIMRYATIAALLVFSFASLQHDLVFWMHTSERVKAACQVASDAGNTVAVSGLPRSISGVPAFANGFPECVELSAGHPTEVNFVRSPTSETESAVFIWDDTKELLHNGLTGPGSRGLGETQDKR